KQAWKEDCTHYAPHLYQILEAAHPEPLSLENIVTADIRDRITEAVSANDAASAFATIDTIRDRLNEAFIARLAAPEELREPTRTLRIGGPRGADAPEFVEARQLVRDGKKAAIQRFRSLLWTNRGSTMRQS